MADFPWEDEYATPEAAYPWEENYDSYFDQVEAADAAREMAAEPDFAADARPEDFAARGYAPDPTKPDLVEQAQLLDQETGFRANEPSTFEDLAVNPFLAGQEVAKGLIGRVFNQASTNRLSEEDRQRELAMGMQEQYRRESAYAPSDETEAQLRAITEAEGPWEAAKALLNNPRGVAYTVSKSLGMYAPALPFIAGAGAAAGGMAAALPAFATSFGLEYQLALDDVMSRRQLDPGSARDVLTVLQDPELMSEVRERGVKRGLAVGTFDALSAGLAGKLLARSGSSLLSRTGAVAGEIGLQAGAGAAGEGLGQVATGDKINWGEIYLEAAAEVPTSLWEVPANYRHAKAAAERNQFNKELKSALDLNEPPAPLTEQGLAGALGMSLPERQPVPTEREIIERAREDAQRILRGETLDIAETPPVDQLRLNPGYTAPGNEIVMEAVPGGVELAPGALYSRDTEAERPMELPAGPFAATQPIAATIAPSPTELPKPRMRMPAARSTTMPAPEAGATSGQIESPPPTAGTPQAVPTEPPGPREPPGPPPAPPAAPAGPGGPAETPAAAAPTETPPAADEGAKRASAAPTEQFPIEESDFSRQRRESAELTELVEVDAQAALEAFEEDRGEALAWNPKRTAKLKEIVGSGGKIDAYPQVAINNGKFDVGDGRHRIALAAERGETITLAAHPDEVAAIRQRLGAPAAPQSSRIPPLPPPPPDGAAAPGGRVGKPRAPAKADILTPVSRRGRAAKAAAPATESAAPGVSPGAAAAKAAPALTPSEGPGAAPTIDRVPATAAYFDVTGQSQDPDGRPRPRDVVVYDAQGEQVARFPFDKSDDAVAFAGELKKARNLPHRWEYRPASAAQPPAAAPAAAPAESGEPQKTPMVPLSEKAKAAIDGLRKRAALASIAKIKENLKNYGASTSGAKAVLIDRLAAAEEMVALLRANKIQSRQALRKRIWDNKATDELSLRLDELAGILYGGKGAATRPLQTSLFVGDKYAGRISPLLDFVGMPERVEGDVESVTGSPSTLPPATETPKAEPPKAEPPKDEPPSAADAGMADEGAPTTTSTAVEQAPAPTEEPDRETLYGKLRGKDVTVQVEVAGREVEVTRYAAEALREADNLVAALEEIRETCL